MSLLFEKGHTHEDQPRYRVAPYSQSYHCCFEATVLDTHQPEIIGTEHYRSTDGYLHYVPMCECFATEDAVKIAESLNSKEERK